MRWTLPKTRRKGEGEKRRPAGKVSEHGMQVSLFKWAKMQGGTVKELRLLFAVPNGGARHVATAGRLKAEGVKRGVPDVFLPVSRGGYHGLWLELKVGRNKASEEQDWWMGQLMLQGYCVQLVRDDWEAAKEIIERYLAGNYTKDKRATTAGGDVGIGEIR